MPADLCARLVVMGGEAVVEWDGLDSIHAALDAGALVGAKGAISRIRRAPHARFLFRNRTGDFVFDLGETIREQGHKRAFIHLFHTAKRNKPRNLSTTACARVYVTGGWPPPGGSND